MAAGWVGAGIFIFLPLLSLEPVDYHTPKAITTVGSVHMPCKVDKSLSVLFYDIADWFACIVLFLSDILDLNRFLKGVLLIYGLTIAVYGDSYILVSMLLIYFLFIYFFFHLQITGVCKNITLPVS